MRGRCSFIEFLRLLIAVACGGSIRSASPPPHRCRWSCCTTPLSPLRCSRSSQVVIASYYNSCSATFLLMEDFIFLEDILVVGDDTI